MQRSRKDITGDKKRSTIIRNSCSDSSISNKDYSRIRLPEPTWSVQSLGLDKDYEPIDWNEYKKLCRRAVVLITSPKEQKYNNNENNNGNEAEEEQQRRQQQLCKPLLQSIGNMLHMIEQVQQPLPESEQRIQQNLSVEDIYDKPRGVTYAPMQLFSTTTKTISEIGDDSDYDQRKYTRDNSTCFPFVQGKLTNVGGHKYFIVPTSVSSSLSSSSVSSSSLTILTTKKRSK